MNKSQELLAEMSEAGKIEIEVDGKFWTGSGLHDEAPEAKEFSSESQAEKEAEKVKKKYPKSKVELVRNAGMRDEEREEV